MVILFILAFAILSLMILENQYTQNKFAKRKRQFFSGKERQTTLKILLKSLVLRVGGMFENKLITAKDHNQIKTLLLRAGYFSPFAISAFLFVKFGLVFVGLLATGLIFFARPEVLDGTNLLIAVIGVFGLGVLTEKWVEWKGEQRQMKISRYCPDMMDMMVICSESGAGLDVALEKVAKKLDHICPELGEELHLVVDELKVLPNRSQAFRNLASRTLVEELKILATTLNQAMSYGSSIAKTLRVVASDTRQKRLLNMEEAAAKVPSKMGLPLILLVLFPTLTLIAAPSLLGLIAALS